MVGTFRERFEAVSRGEPSSSDDWLAALAFESLGDGDKSLGPPLVRSGSTSASSSDLELIVTQSFPRAQLPQRLALLSGLYQIQDWWEASHDAAQKADDLGERGVSAYWHGIAHRREPDAGNASYWFRRVGRHPIFPRLATEARTLLDEGTASRLMPGGHWDPNAFVDFCCGSRRGDERTAQAIQRLEMLLLLEASLPA